MEILIPVLTLSSLGLLFGIGLALAAKKLCVAADPKIEAVFAQLPGANCGACGRAGCIAFAEGLIKGECTVDKCPVSSMQKKSEIAKLLGQTAAGAGKKVAVLHCCGGNRVKDKFIYDGVRDCIAANLVAGGPKNCSWGCIGFGTCARACPFGAITMNEETALPVVNEAQCTACGSCVAVCPKKLFSLVPDEAKIYVACASQDLGKVVMDVCGVGCIACRKCEKACEHDAMHVIDNLARIDYKKCTGCLACVAVCPTKVIRERSKNNKQEITNAK